MENAKFTNRYPYFVHELHLAKKMTFDRQTAIGKEGRKRAGTEFHLILANNYVIEIVRLK